MTSLIAPCESQSYTILDKITPLWKRIGEPPEIQIGCYRGDSRSTTSIGLIARFILTDCNRSTLASLKTSMRQSKPSMVTRLCTVYCILLNVYEILPN